MSAVNFLATIVLIVIAILLASPASSGFAFHAIVIDADTCSRA